MTSETNRCFVLSELEIHHLFYQVFHCGGHWAHSCLQCTYATGILSFKDEVGKGNPLSVIAPMNYSHFWASSLAFFFWLTQGPSGDLPLAALAAMMTSQQCPKIEHDSNSTTCASPKQLYEIRARPKLRSTHTLSFISAPSTI